MYRFIQVFQQFGLFLRFLQKLRQNNIGIMIRHNIMLFLEYRRMNIVWCIYSMQYFMVKRSRKNVHWLYINNNQSLYLFLEN